MDRVTRRWRVLSNWSIRGKLTGGLVILVMLLLLFALTTALSLRAHSRTIRNLETSIKQAPHRGDLVAAFGSLIDPLVVPTPQESDPAALAAWARLQKDEYETRLRSAQASVATFRRTLDKCGCLATGPKGLNREMTILLQSIDDDFRRLQESTSNLALADRRAEQAQWMLQITAEMIDRTIQMPDPAAHLLSFLEDARADHQFYSWIGLGFVVASIGLVVALATGSYWWIMKPLKSLHADFDRVIGGDHSHRANVTTKDEIHSLASAFNVMTTMFQEVVRDQKDQIQMQTQKLLQSERITGIGFLATGVAHEINNPLGVISLCADAMARQFHTPAEQWKSKDFAEGLEYSQMICKETIRCQNITHRMLDFAHGSQGERNYYDVTAIIREVVELIGHMGKYNDRKVIFDLTKPCEAWVSGEEIRQVVLNLVANALQAMSPGGVLRISLTETIDQLDLTFQDDGSGMAPETLSQLFEPFFTTKEVGQGTGLGLSLTRRIVESHHGSISASSPGIGQGSTFRVRLPRETVASRAA